MHSLSCACAGALSLSPFSFGLIAELLKICIVLNLELIVTIVCNRETGGVLKFFRVNPWALSRFKGFLTKLYNCSANGGAPKEFLMAECRYNQTTPNVTLLLLFEL